MASTKQASRLVSHSFGVSSDVKDESSSGQAGGDIGCSGYPCRDFTRGVSVPIDIAELIVVGALCDLDVSIELKGRIRDGWMHHDGSQATTRLGPAEATSQGQAFTPLAGVRGAGAISHDLLSRSPEVATVPDSRHRSLA